jgi:hypothetical protein
MARKFLTALDLTKNELQNAVVQNLASAPSSPVKGQLYFDSTGNVLYWYNGSGWVAAQGGAGAVPATTVTTQAVGDAAVVGVATTYAREDHKHGREAFGTITAQTAFGAASGNGVATTLARSDHVHGTPTHVAADHSTIPLSALAAAAANISMGGFRITNVGTPTAGTDAANKDYVDNGIAGLSWKESVRIATTANITQSGLTAIDGVTPSANDRVLCKDQSTGSQNGIWLAQSGAWTRALDADAVGELEGATVFVTEGTLNSDTAWTCTTNGAITPGTTTTTWAQFGTSTVAANSIDNTKLADMATLTIKGNDTGATADPKDLTKAAFATMFAGTLGRVFTGLVGGGTSALITHNFNTLYVAVNVFRNSTPWDTVECDVERTSVNSVTLRFTVAAGASEYGFVVIG